VRRRCVRTIKQRETKVEYLRDLLGHIRQIAELVRARKYLEGAGPLGRTDQLKP
jgi:hypothetical protein